MMACFRHLSPAALGLLGLSASGLLGSIITATVGAVLLLLIVGLPKKAA